MKDDSAVAGVARCLALARRLVRDDVRETVCGITWAGVKQQHAYVSVHHVGRGNVLAVTKTRSKRAAVLDPRRVVMTRLMLLECNANRRSTIDGIAQTGKGNEHTCFVCNWVAY